MPIKPDITFKTLAIKTSPRLNTLCIPILMFFCGFCLALQPSQAIELKSATSSSVSGSTSGDTGSSVKNASAQQRQTIRVPAKPIRIRSLYGTVEENSMLIKALLVHPALNRLKKIDNIGPGRYFRAMPGYSLFDHALGVFALLKRFQRPVKEQIAGLLEAVPHSVFAHQGTLYLRPNNSTLPYYLAAHAGYMKKVGVEALLNRAKLTSKDVHSTNVAFSSINKNPPFLSAFEIEMTLRLAFTYKLLSRGDIDSILSDLRFEDGKWIFVTQKSAHRLARLSLYFAERYWGAHQNYVINRWVAAAIKRALELNILSINDVRFGTDQNVLKRLMSAKDNVVKGLMLQCRQPFRFYDVVSSDTYDDLFKPEFRGLNPLVKVGGKTQRLTTLDSKYKQDFDRLRQQFIKGIRIKYKQGQKGIKPFRGQQNAGLGTVDSPGADGAAREYSGSNSNLNQDTAQKTKYEISAQKFSSVDLSTLSVVVEDEGSE